MCKKEVTVVRVLEQTTPQECRKEITMVSLSDGNYGVTMKEYGNPVHFNEFQCECNFIGHARKVFKLLVDAENQR